MNVPPLPPMRENTYQVSGKVTIHPSAAIAAGVILRADANSHLIIGEGVCIGAGSILHARQGELTLEGGAILGTGVLLFGHGVVGRGACIGSWSTLLDPKLEPQAVVEPNSLVGDRSRTVPALQEEPMGTPSSGDEKPLPPQAPPQENPLYCGTPFTDTPAVNPAPVGSPLNPYPIQPPLSAPPLRPEWQLNPQQVLPPPTVQAALSTDSHLEAQYPGANLVPAPPTPDLSASGRDLHPPNPETVNQATSSATLPATGSGQRLGAPVYGKEAVHRLMDALFPNRHVLNPPQQNAAPPLQANPASESDPPQLTKGS